LTLASRVSGGFFSSPKTTFRVAHTRSRVGMEREGSPDPIRNSRRQMVNARQGASPYSKRPPGAFGGIASSIFEVKDDVHFVREALKVNRDRRTEAQLGVIRKWLEGVKFNHLNMDDVRSVIPQLAQSMEFVEHAAFQPLFEQGEPTL
jgi:hypothetical protein